MSIGKRIKERRKALKITADELALKLGKDRSTIYRYEKGDIENLPLDILVPIANALDTSPAYLMGWIEEEVDKKNNTITDVVIRMRTDENFMSVCLLLKDLDSEQIASVKQMLLALTK